jgi:CHAT domain-containing protein
VPTLARALHAQRLAPLAKHLDGVRRLFVVPVNAMAGIPVEVLTDQYTVSYVPSGTFLARLKDRPLSTSARVLALGNPTFQRHDSPTKVPTDLPPGGLLITTVLPGGNAATARLLPGDVLLQYAGTELTSVEQLAQLIQANAQAKSVAVVVWREGQAKTTTRDLAPGKLGVVLAKEPAPLAVKQRRETDQMLAALGRGDKTWKALPGTRVELARLSGLFGQEVTILERSDASEQRLEEMRQKGELQQFRYLHFATHGAGNTTHGFASALILAQDHVPKDAPLPEAKGLNGYLLAREVLEDWKLDAELVTLSACETGHGSKGGGEGSLGFSQAFLTAGSRSVCLSLWRVDDAATALLMDRFYANLSGKREGLKAPLGKAEALREAKEWLRALGADEAARLTAAFTNGVARGKDEPALELALPKAEPPGGDKQPRPFAHPRYWAAFVLIGDPD